MFWENCKKKNQGWGIESFNKKRKDMVLDDVHGWIGNLFSYDNSLQKGIDWGMLAEEWRKVCDNCKVIFGFTKYRKVRNTDIGKIVQVMIYGKWYERMLVKIVDGRYIIINNVSARSLWNKCRVKI